MRMLQTPAAVAVAVCWLLTASLAWGDGNPEPDLVLIIRNSPADEVPADACVFPYGVNPYTELQCFDRKLAAGNFGFLSVHVGGAENGFTGLPFGILSTGAPVTFLEFALCPSFELAPSQVGPPSAILVTSTAGCRQSREAVGYLKYVCANTSMTFFTIVNNAELGTFNVINCDYTVDKYTRVLSGAQWGGSESIVICPTVGVGIEATTWGRLKTIFR